MCDCNKMEAKPSPEGLGIDAVVHYTISIQGSCRSDTPLHFRLKLKYLSEVMTLVLRSHCEYDQRAQVFDKRAYVEFSATPNERLDILPPRQHE